MANPENDLQHEIRNALLEMRLYARLIKRECITSSIVSKGVCKNCINGIEDCPGVILWITKMDLIGERIDRLLAPAMRIEKALRARHE